MPAPNLQVELAVSNMDLYPYALPGRPSWGSGLESMAPFLEQTGFRNFEIHPTTRIRDEVLRPQSIDAHQLIGSLIGSMHQTFNSGKGVFGRIADRRGVVREEDSVITMRTMQLSLANRVPTIVYPEHLPQSLVPLNGMSLAAMQPKAEEYVYLHNRFGDLGPEVYRNDGLRLANRRLGIRYLCPDTVHSRRRGKYDEPVPDIEDVWGDQFKSGDVVQMHAAANRVDMKSSDPMIAARSQQEFSVFTSGNWQAARAMQMGQMLVEAISMWQKPDVLDKPVLRVVAEIPPVPMNYRASIVQHARFAETLAEIARSAGARPLMYGD